MASELLRPSVVQFLDEMLRTEDRIRINELSVTSSSRLVGQKLADADFRRLDLLVLAIKRPADRGWLYNPRPDTLLEAGMTLVLLGAIDRVTEFRGQIDASA
jgi:voltage-gated potassium channel